MKRNGQGQIFHQALQRAKKCQQHNGPRHFIINPPEKKTKGHQIHGRRFTIGKDLPLYTLWSNAIMRAHINVLHFVDIFLDVIQEKKRIFRTENQRKDIKDHEFRKQGNVFYGHFFFAPINQPTVHRRRQDN